MGEALSALLEVDGEDDGGKKMVSKAKETFGAACLPLPGELRFVLMFVCCLFVVCLLFVCCLCVVCLLFVCCLFVVCLLFVFCLFVVCLLFVCCLFVVCLFFFLLYLFIVFVLLLFVSCLFLVCLLLLFVLFFSYSILSCVNSLSGMCSGRRSTSGGSAGGRPGVGRTCGNPGWRGYRSRAPPRRRWSGPFYPSIFPIFYVFSNYELSGPGWQDSTLDFRTCPRGRRGGGILSSCAVSTFSLCSAKKSLTLLSSFGFNHFSRLS